MFLITKKYLNSELFENHWKEANETKKDIVIFLLEQDLELNQDQFMNYKVSYIIDFMEKFNYSFKYTQSQANEIEKIVKLEEMSDEENAIFEFLFKLGEKLAVS